MLPSILTWKVYQVREVILLRSLRIEAGAQVPDYLTPAPRIREWSVDLPPLELLQKENIVMKESPFFSTSNPTNLVITGDKIKPFFEAFGNRISYTFFQNGNQMYGIIARPFLPHENLNKFSEFPADEEFELPFSCNN